MFIVNYFNLISDLQNLFNLAFVYITNYKNSCVIMKLT
ncbi:hypothetical protein HMPREF9713_01733 [Myroides odoratimimus CCUG 12700]|nr:hypothetical protein HMPREF9713_01733 [Myroides odoratimimus CCUG 12700]